MSQSGYIAPGKIQYVGSGTGDPGLLTVYGRDIITTATLVYLDPEVPASISDLIGSALDSSGPDTPKSYTGSGATNTDYSGSVSSLEEYKCTSSVQSATLAEPVPMDNNPAYHDSLTKIRPALGTPEELAHIIASTATHGQSVVRLVMGDPLTSDRILREVKELTSRGVTFEVLPGVNPATVIPGYAGMALGSHHTVADICYGAQWDTLAVSSLPLALMARPAQLEEISTVLQGKGLLPDTPVAVTCHGATCQQKTVETVLSDLSSLHSPSLGEIIAVTVGSSPSARAELNWWESRSLFGWNVLVPRTKEQARAMSDRLAYYGAIAHEVPTISVEPPRSPVHMERAIKGILDGRYQWVVFTSTNAVKAVWEKFEEFGLDSRALSGIKIACVGQSTAQKVRAMGIEPELIPSGEQSSNGLLEVFPPSDTFPDAVHRVLLPRADIATETLAAGLREYGWEIDDVTAYRTVRAAPPPAATREMIKTGGFDAVCFTSSSTVRNLLGIAGKPHPRTLIACIGPKTAETARELGVRVDVQPDNASVIDLVDSLATLADKLRAEGALPPPRKKTRRSRSS